MFESGARKVKPPRNWSLATGPSAAREIEKGQTENCVRRGKALPFSGCESRPATDAPAGSSQGGSWR